MFPLHLVKTKREFNLLPIGSHAKLTLLSRIYIHICCSSVTNKTNSALDMKAMHILTVPIFESVKVPPVTSSVPNFPFSPSIMRRFISDANSNILRF